MCVRCYTGISFAANVAEKVLETEIYVLGEFQDPGTDFGKPRSFGRVHKIEKILTAPDIEAILEKQLGERKKGRMMISSEDAHSFARARKMRTDKCHSCG
jgi:hypothetical protein